jgi:ArsR family transcriptional regulator
VFQALSDPLRLRLLALLPSHDTSEPISVCNLAKRAGISQPNASHHLKILRSAGLIRCHKEGGCSYYVVDPERVEGALRDVAERFTSTASPTA